MGAALASQVRDPGLHPTHQAAWVPGPRALFSLRGVMTRRVSDHKVTVLLVAPNLEPLSTPAVSYLQQARLLV